MPFPEGVEPMNLYSFRQTVRDVSRPYLFMVEMPFIDGNNAKVTAFARSTTLPKYSVGTIEIPFQSQKLRFAGPATIDGTWQIEFLCDELHSLRNRFMQWLQIEYNPQALLAGAPVSYKYDNCKVYQLARNGEVVVSYQFVGLFPTNVGEVALNHEETGYSRFPVEFAYDYFTVSSNDPFNAAQDVVAFNYSDIGIANGTDPGAIIEGEDINGNIGIVGSNGGA